MSDLCETKGRLKSSRNGSAPVAKSKDCPPPDLVASDQPPSASFRGRHTAVGPLPLRSEGASLELVRELQLITCVNRSLIEIRGKEVFICFESLEDAATFLETWIFLVEQMAMDVRRDNIAGTHPAQLRLVQGLSNGTLSALEHYLSAFGHGAYLVADEDGLFLALADPNDIALVKQQFREVLR